MTAKAGSFKRPVLLIALLLGGGVSTTAEDQLAVTAVRYWSLADVTRIAVEVSGPFTYRMDRLSSPDRAFFDLKETRQLLTRKGMYTVPVGDPRVRQVRVAEPQPSITRVVLDLEDGPLEVVASQLSVPDRLVIEVRAKGEVPPATTLSKSGVEKIEERPVQASDKPSEKPAPPAPRLETAPAENVARESPKPADPAAVARPARRNSNGERSMTRVLGLKLRRVVLDPGHGGQDHGSTGPGGVVEKELVLDVTRRLGALVEGRMGSEVVYTRSDDSFIALEERTHLANTNKADIFLSIHANSSQIKTVSGVETYYLSFTTSRTALELAARENASSKSSIHELKELIQQIALKDKVDESREFASKVHTALRQVSAPAPKTGPQRDRGVKRAPFVVLIGASMPSVLAEIGFLSNTREETQLKKPEYRQRLAEALYKGLAQYADSLSQFQMAQRRRSGDE